MMHNLKSLIWSLRIELVLNLLLMHWLQCGNDLDIVRKDLLVQYIFVDTNLIISKL